MNKFLLLLLLPMLLFAAVDTAYIHKLETGFNYEVWGNDFVVGLAETLYIETAVRVGKHNLFAVEMIQGDTLDIDVFFAALTTDKALKPWDWQDLITFQSADIAMSYYWNWNQDTLAFPFDIYCWFRLCELGGGQDDRDTTRFRFKRHSYCF